jgi:hypothetical protein
MGACLFDFGRGRRPIKTLFGLQAFWAVVTLVLSSLKIAMSILGCSSVHLSHEMPEPKHE